MPQSGRPTRVASALCVTVDVPVLRPPRAAHSRATHDCRPSVRRAAHRRRKRGRADGSSSTSCRMLEVPLMVKGIQTAEDSALALRARRRRDLCVEPWRTAARHSRGAIDLCPRSSPDRRQSGDRRRRWLRPRNLHFERRRPRRRDGRHRPSAGARARRGGRERCPAPARASRGGAARDDELLGVKRGSELDGTYCSRRRPGYASAPAHSRC